MRTLVALVLPVLLSAVGCTQQECVVYNDCPSGHFCSNEYKCVEYVGGGPDVCAPGGTNDYILPQGSVSPSFASHYTCRMPQENDTELPTITGLDGNRTLVSGGSTELAVSWDGADSLDGLYLYVAPSNTRQMYVRELSDLPNPFDFEMFMTQSAAGGTFYTTFALADAPPDEEPNIGGWYEGDFEVIAVQGGDIQISASWDSETDVDLHVEDPQGGHVFYGNRSVESGGGLDLDANAACGNPSQHNENIYWPDEVAPAGQYKVWVDYWSNCDFSGQTTVRLTRVLAGTPPRIETYEVVLTPDDVASDPYGASQPVFTFSWP